MVLVSLSHNAIAVKGFLAQRAKMVVGYSEIRLT